MFRKIKTIEGEKVLLVSISKEVGWFCNINGKEYGDFVKLEKTPLKNYDGEVEEVFGLLETQAKKTIIKIKNGE